MVSGYRRTGKLKTTYGQERDQRTGESYSDGVYAIDCPIIRTVSAGTSPTTVI